MSLKYSDLNFELVEQAGEAYYSFEVLEYPMPSSVVLTAECTPPPQPPLPPRTLTPRPQ